ncbi:hypothetical protein K9N68_36850 (plasmid) [Kovacikia minuta CCNUW1]|uniref:IS1/IS1595 family N-terminal zinc-binding domain-containing protein n=1 Tax=Kovacikia minuta TaxID=2931930 RepID=UPI001CC9D9D5|nr:hypothetical protein [Kovacikia minuta]UBF29798.1 hypothetical protein K9N68_36850 [Kovacikia minuta CCNUW1]
MQCPNCGSTEIRKNGKRGSKQNHICTHCHRQFIDVYDPPQGYSKAVKQHCLTLYANGMGFRAIERSTGVHHTTVNTRLRHYLARLHRKTLCYSKSVEMLAHSIRLLLHYLKYRSIPVFS